MQIRQAQHTASESEFERLLDVAEAARLLRIHPKILRAKAGHGIIPGIQIGRVWRFRASMLNRWLEGIAGNGRR
jgi:excisionase family DNA binding protein